LKEQVPIDSKISIGPTLQDEWPRGDNIRIRQKFLPLLLIVMTSLNNIW
jgi:hypothetical protein